MPGLELANHERLRQRVEIAPHGRLGYPERARRVGGRPGLPVVVRQHPPEPQHGGRGNVEAELRQIDFDMACDRVQAPGEAVFVRGGQIGAWEAAAQPEAGFGLRGTVAGGSAGFAQVEPADLEGLNPAQQRFARLAQQGRGSAAKEEVLPGRVRAVDQHAQDREQSGPPLDFVDDHQTGQRCERVHRLVQAPRVARVFQVKVVGRIACEQCLCERCLAGLARPGKHHGPGTGECARQAAGKVRAGDHGGILPLESMKLEH